MNTKQKGSIAEQAVIIRFLKLGWHICKPLGDNQGYDLIVDVHGKLAKIQVKSAWYDRHDDNYCIDVRQTKTNRRSIRRTEYNYKDFDFAVIYIDD